MGIGTILTFMLFGYVLGLRSEEQRVNNRILRARLIAIAEEAAAKEASDARRSQVRTVDRSERIRTYNFPQGRVTDHRINLTLYNLSRIIAGDGLSEIVDALILVIDKPVGLVELRHRSPEQHQ